MAKHRRPPTSPMPIADGEAASSFGPDNSVTSRFESACTMELPDKNPPVGSTMHMFSIVAGSLPREGRAIKHALYWPALPIHRPTDQAHPWRIVSG